MIMDDPPCTQLLLISILHWVVVDDSCDIELLHLLQLEEFSLKFGWSVVEVHPSTSRATCWGSALGPPKTYLKHQTSGVMTGCLGSPFYPHDLPGKLPLHFLKVLESTTTLFQDFPCLWNFFSGRLGDQDFPFMEWIWGPYHGWWFQPIWKVWANMGIFPKVRGENKTYIRIFETTNQLSRKIRSASTQVRTDERRVHLKSHPIEVRKNHLNQISNFWETKSANFPGKLCHQTGCSYFMFDFGAFGKIHGNLTLLKNPEKTLKRCFQSQGWI